jgi:hypothetical protein
MAQPPHQQLRSARIEALGKGREHGQAAAADQR